MLKKRERKKKGAKEPEPGLASTMTGEVSACAWLSSVLPLPTGTEKFSERGLKS